MLQSSNQVPQTTVTNTSTNVTMNINPTSHIPINDNNVWNQSKPIPPTVQPHGKTSFYWYNIELTTKGTLFFYKYFSRRYGFKTN